MQLLDSGKIVTLYQLYKQLTSDDLRILRSLALEMISFTESYLIYHKRLFSSNRTLCTVWLQRMEQLHAIFRSKRDYGDYRITPLLHLFLLLEIARTPDKESLAFLHTNYDLSDEEDREEFLPQLFSYLQNGEVWNFAETDELEVSSLIPLFIYFEELIPAFIRFTPLLKITCWNQYYDQQLAALRPINWQWFDQNIAPYFESEHELLISVTERNELAKKILTSSINDPNNTSIYSVAGVMNIAFQMQLAGNYEKAIEAYEEAMRIEKAPEYGKKLNFPTDTLYSLSYAVALVGCNTERTRKRIQAILKKKEMKEENSFFATYLFLSAATESMFTRDINRTATYRLNSPLTALLYCWVCKNFDLPIVEHELIDESFVLIKEDSYALLEAITAHYYPDINKIGIDKTVQPLPFLPSYRKLKPWESILDKLLKDPSLAPKAEAKHTEIANTRIIYLITRNHSVVPLLQRSKDGETWKGGRKISIKTFSEGIAEMNDTDRAVSHTVRRYRGGWGSSYEYVLEGEQTLAALAGYPLVFLYTNPDIPVDIVKLNPYISVTRQGESFRIQTNVVNPEDNTLTHIQIENDTRISVIQLTLAQQHIIQQLMRIAEYPIESEGMLKELLGRITGTLTIHSDLIDTEEKLSQKTGDATPVVQILPLGENYKAELFIKPLGDYPPYCKPGVGNRSVMGLIEGKAVQAIRNFRSENALLQPIAEIFKEINPNATDVLTLESIADCLELLEQLHEQGDTVKIEWPEGEKLKIRNRASSGNFSIIAKKNNRWFEIDGSLKISKNEELAFIELMKKVAESETRFIRLEGDEYLALTTRLRQQLIELNSLLSPQKGKMMLPPLAVPLLSALEQGGIEIQTDTHFQQLTERIEKASSVRHPLPANLQASLREYQEEGYNWMQRLADWGAGACLADDMGLGKTVQAIALLLARANKGAALVVAPASVLSNWESEIRRFAPTLNVYNLNASGASRKELIGQADAFDIVITTYGLLISEAAHLHEKKWSTIVLDEAHVIKNRETKMSKAAMKLSGEFRLILTGTPLQNHLSEIWNLFEFINPGLLGSFQSFTARFIMPIELRQDKQQQRLLKRLLSPFILRRTKNEVLNELPGKTEILLPVDLTKEELTLYETMRRKAEMSLKSKELNAVKTLAEITRLRQAACHPAMVKPDYEGPASKTALFMELVAELRENNHRALVFSQFTSHLDLIQKELERHRIDYLYLDGSTPLPQRSKLVKSFQTGSQPVFLISLKAGGLGLNLTAADYIIHLDPWWNPAIEDQASDRAYRIGQTRPVTVYRLIARHTIEEKIIELHHTKKDLADSLLEGSNMAHKLTREEMLELLQKE